MTMLALGITRKRPLGASSAFRGSPVPCRRRYVRSVSETDESWIQGTVGASGECWLETPPVALSDVRHRGSRRFATLSLARRRNRDRCPESGLSFLGERLRRASPARLFHVKHQRLACEL